MQEERWETLNYNGIQVMNSPKWTEMIIVRKKNDLLMLPCDGEEAVPLD